MIVDANKSSKQNIPTYYYTRKNISLIKSIKVFYNLISGGKIYKQKQKQKNLDMDYKIKYKRYVWQSARNYENNKHEKRCKNTLTIHDNPCIIIIVKRERHYL